MRILYTICGDGNGHAFRSAVVIDHLLQAGHQVAIITSGKGYTYLSQRYGSVLQVHGWSLIYRGNRVKKSTTISKNMAKFKYLPKDLQQIRALVKNFQPAVVISDFEPSGGLIAMTYDLPLISIDNQHIISDSKIPIVRKDYPDYVLARIYTDSVLPNRDYSLVTTFFYPPLKKSKIGSTWLCPPLVRSEVMSAKPSDAGHILVYQTSDGYRELMEILRQSDQKYIIYSSDHTIRANNLIYRDFSPTQLVADLASATAVITNGGFTLISESLALGKPVFSVPIKLQYEQILNARQIEALGYGRMSFEITKPQLESWLRHVPIYRKEIAKLTIDNSILLNKLEALLKLVV